MPCQTREIAKSRLLRWLATPLGTAAAVLALKVGAFPSGPGDLDLDALEARYPVLRGTIRAHGTARRRDFVRFFACEQDLSHEAPNAPVPADAAAGTEAFLIIGAIAGG